MSSIIVQSSVEIIYLQKTTVSHITGGLGNRILIHYRGRQKIFRSTNDTVLRSLDHVLNICKGPSKKAM